MLRSILSILAGVSAGLLSYFLVDMISTSLYPVPLDVLGHEEMSSFVVGLTNTAFGLIVFAHVLGAFVAGLVAGMVGTKKRVILGLIAAMILLIKAFQFSFSYDLSPLFIVLDVGATILFGFLGAKFGASREVG